MFKLLHSLREGDWRIGYQSLKIITAEVVPVVVVVILNVKLIFISANKWRYIYHVPMFRHTDNVTLHKQAAQENQTYHFSTTTTTTYRNL